MMRVLVPVRPDAPAQTRGAIQTAVRLHGLERGELHVHLLSVQPKVSAHVAMYFAEGEVGRIQMKSGREDLAAARELLDAAKVPYTASVRVGRKAQTIAEAAREFRCSRILLGEESPGLAERVFGTLGAQVREIIESVDARVTVT